MYLVLHCVCFVGTWVIGWYLSIIFIEPIVFSDSGW